MSPLGVYGMSKALADREVLRVHPGALIVRTGAFFGPWDEHNFVTVALRALSRGRPLRAASDAVVSPTYVPDLVNAALDLLVDGTTGLWHVANRGEVTWADLARRLTAELAGLDALRVILACSTRSLGLAAPRPPYSALGTQRGLVLPRSTSRSRGTSASARTCCRSGARRRRRTGLLAAVGRRRTRMVVLVTGGAGYIGSVLTEELIVAGHDVVVYDDLSKGHRDAVVEEAAFVEADLLDATTLRRTLREHRVEAVVHMAARSLVGESVADPAKYYRDNVEAGLTLLDAMRAEGAGRLVFSSTAAVYGEPERQPIDEDCPDGADEPLRRDEAGVRARPPVVRAGLRAPSREPALFQCRRSQRTQWRAARSGDPSDSSGIEGRNGA